MNGYDYDLVIVGSGGAAFAAAIRARDHGARVALVERGTAGGTCVNVGCVPSKALLAAAHAAHTAGHHPFAGIGADAPRVDVATVIAAKDELVKHLRQAKYLDLSDSYGFPVLRGSARFADPDTLLVDGAPLSAGAFVLATGADARVPELPGIGEVDHLTSTTSMELTAPPRRLVTIGAGYVGAEQSQLWSRLGSEVTLVGRLAPRAEPELTAMLSAALAEEGLRLIAERAVAVRRHGEEVVVVTDGGQEATADRLLLAVGRAPRTPDLNLAAAGVATDPGGFITVDAHQRTSNPRVWAAGDVTGGPEFVYVAAVQGATAAEDALTGRGRPVDYTGLPAVMFTSPGLASAGLTEQQALDQGYRCDCRVLDLAQVPRALVNRDTRGAIKLVIDAGTRRVLGVSAVAENAGEIMLAATYAIKARMTVDDIADTWAPYLTMSEALRLVALSFRRDPAQLSCCAA